MKEWKKSAWLYTIRHLLATTQPEMIDKCMSPEMESVEKTLKVRASKRLLSIWLFISSTTTLERIRFRVNPIRKSLCPLNSILTFCVQKVRSRTRKWWDMMTSPQLELRVIVKVTLLLSKIMQQVYRTRESSPNWWAWDFLRMVQNMLYWRRIIQAPRAVWSGYFNIWQIMISTTRLSSQKQQRCHQRHRHPRWPPKSHSFRRIQWWHWSHWASLKHKQKGRLPPSDDQSSVRQTCSSLMLMDYTPLLMKG